jgi:hypothetical protein
MIISIVILIFIVAILFATIFDYISKYNFVIQRLRGILSYHDIMEESLYEKTNTLKKKFKKSLETKKAPFLRKRPSL